MRSITTCLNRIKCGLPCTKEEFETVSEWLDYKKVEQKWAVSIVVICILLITPLFILIDYLWLGTA